MAGIADFFGAETGYTLRELGSAEVGGVRLPLRPLTTEQFLTLVALLGDQQDDIVTALDSGKFEEGAFDRWLRVAWSVVYPTVPADVLAAATPEEIGTLITWYRLTHDWPRIAAGYRMRDGEGADEGQDAEGVDAMVDLFLLVERKSSRRIEELLSMRPEASLSYTDAVFRQLWRENNPGKPYPRKWKDEETDDCSVLDLMPGMEWVDAAQQEDEDEDDG